MATSVHRQEVVHLKPAPLLQVLVGRNHTENDLLSHEVAAKTDLWFHARGCAGSHTVLRIPAGRWCTHLSIDSLYPTFIPRNGHTPDATH